MTCHSKQQSEADTRLFVFASQQIKGKACDVKQIISSDKIEFDVLDYYEFSPKEPHPYGLFLLATGQVLTKKEVWTAYRKSNKIYFFVCQKSNSNTK